jgi:hypothetical protein
VLVRSGEGELFKFPDWGRGPLKSCDKFTVRKHVMTVPAELGIRLVHTKEILQAWTATRSTIIERRACRMEVTWIICFTLDLWRDGKSSCEARGSTLPSPRMCHYTMHNGDREPKEGSGWYWLVFFRYWEGGVLCIPLMASSLHDTGRDDKWKRGLDEKWSSLRGNTT